MACYMMKMFFWVGFSGGFGLVGRWELGLGIAADEDRRTKTTTVIRSRRDFGRFIGGGMVGRECSVGLDGCLG